mmetsp:Transcript_107261/g.268890  ORF Transcript_107261/g.268890 Transcript_107261/m.268890 type:complete len:373 (+) Transcript_107261:72-1190(+)
MAPAPQIKECISTANLDHHVQSCNKLVAKLMEDEALIDEKTDALNRTMQTTQAPQIKACEAIANIDHHVHSCNKLLGNLTEKDDSIIDEKTEILNGTMLTTLVPQIKACSSIDNLDDHVGSCNKMAANLTQDVAIIDEKAETLNGTMLATSAPQIRGCGSISIDYHLRACNKLVEDLMEDDAVIEENMEALSGHMRTTMKPKVEAIFQFYDTEKKGFWTTAEAAAFFVDFVNEYPIVEIGWLSKGGEMVRRMAMWAKSVKAEAGQIVMEQDQTSTFQQMMGGMDFPALSASKEPQFNEEMARQIADYRENQDARHEQAFRFVDGNDDGKLELADLASALDASSAKHAEMLEALGLRHNFPPLKKEEGFCAVM